MGVLRVTGWEKDVPFPPVVSPCDWGHRMAERPNSHIQQWEETSENHAAKPPGDTGRERQKFLGATRWLTIWWFPETWKALLGWLRGNTQASVNQSKPKWKEEKVTGKKAEASAEQYIREAVAWEECSLFCFNHYEPDMVDGSCLAAGGCPCGLILSVCPPSSHGSLSVARALMAFTCLICAHRILVGIVLICKKKKKKGETLTHSSGRYFGRSEQWGVWNTPEGNPGQHSSVASRAVAFWMRVPVRKEKWGQGWVGVGGARDSKSLNKPQKCHGLGAGWKRISRHETIRVWFFSFCILRPSLVLSALHSLGNHNLGRKNHFNYLVYALYLSDCFYQSLESAREITKNQ